MSIFPFISNALPAVTELDAGNDRGWFADHPNRSFRARTTAAGVWLVRRRRQGFDQDVLLRTLALPPPPRDDDLEIGAAWYASAFGLERQPALKAARKLLRSARPRSAS
jgi:hypothetical protein